MSIAARGVSPHPTALALGSELCMVLVDDQPQATDPIIFGEPTLGWAGDPRIGVYYWPRKVADASTYVLVRMCDDGEYRIIMQLPGNRPLSPAGVNRAVRQLVAIDAHRGFDAHAAVVAHNDRVDAERARRADEWVDEEVAPRLAWAYKRDRGGHLGGSHFDFSVPAVPWHGVGEASQAEGD